MNWKSIFTEDAVRQFKKEGATHATVAILRGPLDEIISKSIREIDVELEDKDKHFMIAAKNSAAEAMMNKYFHGEVINGERWFPFYSPSPADMEKLLKGIAKTTEVDPSHLKWAYIDVADYK